MGRANWLPRRIPDIRNPVATKQLHRSQQIDVLILGDGFQARAEFEEQLQAWIEYVYQLKVYDLFQGPFCIRAI
jgi:hypothetical protein